MTTQTLAPGSAARIYRDGGVLVASCVVPGSGRFEVRGLPPGQYVARDECGGEQAFEVHANVETTVVAGAGGPVAPGASGGPGTSSVAEAPALHVGPAPVITEPEQVAAGKRVTKQVANKASDVETVPRPPARVEPDNEPGDDERVPAQAGSSIVQEVPSGVGDQLPDGANVSGEEHAANDVRERPARSRAKRSAPRRTRAKSKK